MERRPVTENIHHIYFDRKSWNGQTLSRTIRNLEVSKVLMPIEDHNDLHHNTHAMGIPSAYVARLALDRITSRNRRYSALDVVRDSEDYLRSIGENYYDDATDIADRLLEQIPFIQVGVDSLKRRFIA